MTFQVYRDSIRQRWGQVIAERFDEEMKGKEEGQAVSVIAHIIVDVRQRFTDSIRVTHGEEVAKRFATEVQKRHNDPIEKIRAEVLGYHYNEPEQEYGPCLCCTGQIKFTFDPSKRQYPPD